AFPVRCGLLAGGVLDAAGKELVDYLFRGGHLFLRGDALEERGDLLDALVAGAHLPGSLRPRLPAAALFAAREDRGQRREVPVDAEAVPPDAALGGAGRAHESHRHLVALAQPHERLLERVELGLGPRTRGGAGCLDADGASAALSGRPGD